RPGVLVWDFSALARLEFFDLPRVSVEKPERHLILLDRRNCDRRNSLAASDRTEPLVGGRFNAYLLIGHTKCRSNFLSYLRDLWTEFWRFCDYSCINIHNLNFLIAEHLRHASQNVDAADSANPFVGVWKMLADVTCTNRAEKGIRDCMRQNICIGMPFEPEQIGN